MYIHIYIPIYVHVHIFVCSQRDGFALERILFKNKICKSCVISEYNREVKISSEVANPADHNEWLVACDKVSIVYFSQRTLITRKRALQ